MEVDDVGKIDHDDKIRKEEPKEKNRYDKDYYSYDKRS